jgi:hypothetical protein
MREIRSYGSEGGGIETNRCFLPLSGSSFVPYSFSKYVIRPSGPFFQV